MMNDELRISKKSIDITDRTFRFAASIIAITGKLPKSPSGFAIANQIVRSGTSIGANVQEAQSAISRKDFIHTMNISLKETRETNYWLKLIGQALFIKVDKFLQESEEIIRILASIVKKSKQNS